MAGAPKQNEENESQKWRIDREKNKNKTLPDQRVSRPRQVTVSFCSTPSFCLSSLALLCVKFCFVPSAGPPPPLPGGPSPSRNGRCLSRARPPLSLSPKPSSATLRFESLSPTSSVACFFSPQAFFGSCSRPKTRTTTKSWNAPTASLCPRLPSPTSPKFQTKSSSTSSRRSEHSRETAAPAL